MSKPIAILGRILLALIFAVAGARMLLTPGEAKLALLGAGLPVSFTLVAGLFQLIFGLCLAFGFAVRAVSVLLGLFCAATILFFHHRIDDPVQVSAALRDLALIGGLMLAFAHSHMWHHYYALREARREDLAAHDAELRAHEAELRAARAEAVQPHVQPVTHVTYDAAPITRRRRWWDW
ncbi:DoxX family protein [Novosphingobium sp. 9]|uniref:DoxX family protein n=1 Tax=Novosphingobium sp. 9 TaxID=2025349 RepID=UPI0021B5CC45|nr:DoxX family protein [Novosphingobium sp. 9]